VPAESTEISPKYDSHTPAPEQDGEPQHWDSRQKNGNAYHRGSISGGIQEEASLFHRHISNDSGSLSQSPGFSMLRGTKLALFGMQIDLANFADNESDINSPKAFNGFIEHAFSRTGPMEPAALPPTLQDAKTYAQWYFNFLNPYTAVIDKRDMHELVSQRL
jgi:hypothetical protein